MFDCNIEILNSHNEKQKADPRVALEINKQKITGNLFIVN